MSNGIPLNNIIPYIKGLYFPKLVANSLSALLPTFIELDL
jgi:hypothetical protein